MSKPFKPQRDRLAKLLRKARAELGRASARQLRAKYAQSCDYVLHTMEQDLYWEARKESDRIVLDETVARWNSAIRSVPTWDQKNRARLCASR